MPSTIGKPEITFSGVVGRAFTLLFLDEKPRQAVSVPQNQMTCSSLVCENEKRMSLVFEDLEELPFSLVAKYASWVKTVDLSHNRFSDVRFLEHFDTVDSVILDHNRVTSETTFPRLPSLLTLWLNHNRIEDLPRFLRSLASRCPNLLFLSLMGNKAAPSSINGATQADIDLYRRFVISSFPSLKFLDDRRVTSLERQESYPLPSPKRSSVFQALDSFSLFVESKLMRKNRIRIASSGVV